MTVKAVSALAFVVLGLLVPAAAVAQLQTGTILVKAVDEHGAPIPGVTLTVSGAAIIGGQIIPRTSFLIAGAYPTGAQLTVAGHKWDARLAVVDGSPVRGRNFFGSNRPPRMANWVAGFGITPYIGVRLGAAFASGPYARAAEPFVANKSPGDRSGCRPRVVTACRLHRPRSQ